MAETMPPIALDYAGDGAPVVLVADEPAPTLEAARRLAPALDDPLWVVILAQVANHLAQGERFGVIVDPAAFRADYLAARAAEDPEEPPEPGQLRLRNYGLPDFDQITPPRLDDGTLVFFARNTEIGIPYRASMPDGAGPDYRPVAMFV